MLLLWLAALLVTFTQCRKEAVPPKIDDTIVTPPVTNGGIPAASEVNTFVWSSMHDVYLWNDKIPSLTNTYYQPLTTTSPNYNRNKDSLNAYLNKYTDPSQLFADLLYQHNVVDKWSFINSDYTVIEDWINNVSKTMGCDFQGYYLNSSQTDVYVVVRYVLKGSPADLAGIQRGDVFYKVDGIQLTGANYSTLISKDSFTLSFAKLVNNNGTLTLSPISKTAAITTVVLQENPVFLSKVIPVNAYKVGYLVYNGFTSNFDVDLNNEFQKFKSAGVNKLVVDLRYNGGGSVQTAIYLASMIYSTNTSKIFTKSVWNSLYSSYNSSDSFTDKIVLSATNSVPINSLNLPDVYFIVSKETASASELLINGLRPYANTKVIGTNTYGKYVASVTIYDYAVDSNGNLIKDSSGNYVKVSTHKYAMQPIVAKYANSLGVSDFVNGLTPDISANEERWNLLPLGDENETLLKVALDDIKGLKSQVLPISSAMSNAKSIFGSKDQNRFSRDMYVDPQKFVRQTK